MSNLYRGPSIYTSVSIHLAMGCQRRRLFKNRPKRNKNCPWRPCLLMERDKMCILYRGPSRHTSYEVSVHLVKRFQSRRFFRNQPIRNNNCLWRPCLITDRNEMSNFDREPFIDASYQDSDQLWLRFQRKRYFRNQPIRNKNCLWRSCLLTDRDKLSKLYRTFHRCFLPSFGPFGQTVSEEKNLKNQPIRNKNRLWRPYLVMDRDEMSNLFRGPSICASYQVSDHLAKRFQRRRI